jgi:hypothetical protein
MRAMNCIDLAQDGNKCRPVVKVVMDHQSP